jgi:DnaJ like chaperone protein
LPSEVKGALTILNLEAAASFDAVRQAYRQMIKSYHPDKVAHLGPDLQKLAEVKTKMINASFMILENFFSKSDGQKA